MAGERERWQALLVVAEKASKEFWRQSATVKGYFVNIRINFDVSRRLTELRAQLPTQNDIVTVRGMVSNASELRRVIAHMAAAVVGGAPSSSVTKDIVAMGVEAGNELSAAEQLAELARQRHDRITVLMNQIAKESEEAANFMLLADRKIAAANAHMVRAEVRIRRAIDQIGNV